MDLAGLARNLVGIGKARLGSKTPATAGHYHVLPSASIKPRFDRAELDSIEHPVVSGISPEHIQKEIAVGDGGAKHRLIDPPNARHSVADPHAVPTLDTVARPALPTPTTS